MANRRPIVTFDLAKSVWNVAQPGRADLPFEAAERFDFDTALIRQDTRLHPKTGTPYPEPRFQATGRIRRQIVLMVFTPTADGFRVISLRPADRKERKAWNESLTTS